LASDDADVTAMPAVPPPIERHYDAGWVVRTAQEHHLDPIGVRPPLKQYIKDLWARRSFIRVLGVSKAQAKNGSTYLGQVWALLTPILNAAVYVGIFGLLLKVDRGVANAPAFIVVGTFMYRFFEMSVHAGSKSIRKNMNLMRSVSFPRAVLPIAGVLTELTNLLPALVVMCIISYLVGFLPGKGSVPITWSWFLLIPAVALMVLFSIGCAFFIARLVARTPDLDNVLPFILRVLMYGSGVIFSVDHYLGDYSWGWIGQYQPVAVYLGLARAAVLNEPSYPLDGTMWLLGVFWAVLFLVGGFLFFWRGEETYGRD
jgi:teichoic acid transport system permease protein